MSVHAAPVFAFQDEKADEINSNQEIVASAVEKYGKRSAVCIDGFADEYPCANINLVGMLSLSDLGAGPGIGLNDGWGWVDPDTNKRYALVGREDGTAFVDVSNPSTPLYVGELLKPNSAHVNVWRDIKVDGYFAFVVADGGQFTSGPHGMQVFDLRKLRSYAGTPLSFSIDAVYTGFGVAHNVAINEETNRAYVVGAHGGGESCGGGLHIIDIQDPLEPRFLGCFADVSTGRFSTGYTHDTQCLVYRGPDVTYAGREICVSSNETAISVADVTDAAAPIRISKGTYPASAYVHQGWFTEDQRYFIQNDELDERSVGGTTRTMIWDLEDLDEPELLSVYHAPISSVDHNLYIRDGFAFQANYSSGLRVLDVRNPLFPDVVGWFDTTPDRADNSFSGTWTAYPFPQSSLVMLTSRDEGLFLVEPASMLGTRFNQPQADVSDEQATISWTMAYEQNVEKYVVEVKTQDGPFESVQEVISVAGTSQNISYSTSFPLSEGVYTVRISARSANGNQFDSNELTVVSMNGRFLFDPVFPNPVVNSASSRLAVETGQHVVVHVFDVSGKQVATLFDSFLNEGVELPLSFDASSSPKGPYFLRVIGELFTATREMVVVR